MVELIGSIILFSAFIGFFMEVYKKGLRRDKAGVWEIRVVATFMSLIFCLITYSITPSLAVKYSFVLIAFYTVLIYILPSTSLVITVDAELSDPAAGMVKTQPVFKAFVGLRFFK